MKEALTVLWDYRTTITGGLQATSGALATASVIPLEASVVFSLVVGILQIWIGVANKIAQGKKD